MGKIGQAIATLKAAARIGKETGLGFFGTIKFLAQGMPPTWLGGTGQQTSKSRDYWTHLKAVTENEWSAVSLFRISDGLMFQDWKIQDKMGKTQVPDNHPAVMLMKRPNPFHDWSTFLEQLTHHWLPTGNGFIYERKSSMAGTPLELWSIRPDRIRIIPDPDTFIRQYEIIGGSGFTPVPVEKMYHIKFGNPMDDYWGLGKIGAAERLFDSDIAAAEYAWRFFKNDATPGFILGTDKSLSDRAYNRMKAIWKEAHQGAKKAHNLAILEEGLKPQNIRQGPRESDFVATRAAAQTAITAIWGVPPLKSGIVEGTNRATAFVQERMWQKDTLVPLLRRLAPLFTRIVERFDTRLEFVFDELVQEDQVEDAQIGAAYLGAGALTPNEVREHYAGLPPIKGNPAMDKFYMGMGLLPIDDMLTPTPLPMEPVLIPAPKPTTPPAPVGPDEPGGQPEADGKMRAGPRGTALQRRMLRHFLIERTSRERTMRKVMKTFFNGQADRVVARFLDNPKFFSSEGKGMSEALELTFEGVHLQRATAGFYSETLIRGFSLSAGLLGYEPELDYGPGNPAFERATKNLAAKVVQINQGTREKLRNVIQEGLALNLSPTAIANGDGDLGYDGIRGMFAGFGQARAQLIARTESARALDFANVEVYKGLGVTTCDVIGCEDNEIMPDQKWGCLSQGVPTNEAYDIEFHPNHKGAIVPVITKASAIADFLSRELLLRARQEDEALDRITSRD